MSFNATFYFRGSRHIKLFTNLKEVVEIRDYLGDIIAIYSRMSFRAVLVVVQRRAFKMRKPIKFNVYGNFSN